MKKYDVRYSQGYDRSHSWRYQRRVEAKNEEKAKREIIDSCKKERPDEKVMNIRVNEAQDFICWTYKSTKLSDGTFGFKKQYYVGYWDLRPFGVGVQLSDKPEEAKRFMMDYDLKEEIKSTGRKLSDFKIEKVDVN